jgi:FkbM family methyltransferase
MNLKTLASHTLDLDLLPESPTVLDVGCRNWDFANAVLAERPKGRVIALDPARDVYDRWKQDERRDGRIRYWPYALVGLGEEGNRQFAHFSTGEADHVLMPGAMPMADWEVYPVACVTIQALMTQWEIQHWDAVKLDCEGSETAILEHWPGAIATQISVEFHDWDKPKMRSESYYDWLWKCLPWYRVVQHELSKQGEGLGHWDSLLVRA